MFPSVLYLWNGWTDSTEIWHVREQLAGQLIQTRDGIHLHVRTSVPFFRISETAGRIALEFGVLLETS